MINQRGRRIHVKSTFWKESRVGRSNILMQKFVRLVELFHEISVQHRRKEHSRESTCRLLVLNLLSCSN